MFLSIDGKWYWNPDWNCCSVKTWTQLKSEVYRHNTEKKLVNNTEDTVLAQNVLHNLKNFWSWPYEWAKKCGLGKVHIFQEGHKNLRNLHRRFDTCYITSIRRWRFRIFLWPSWKIWTLQIKGFYFFLFNHFLEARAETVKENFLVF